MEMGNYRDAFRIIVDRYRHRFGSVSRNTLMDDEAISFSTFDVWPPVCTCLRCSRASSACVYATNGPLIRLPATFECVSASAKIPIVPVEKVTTRKQG